MNNDSIYNNEALRNTYTKKDKYNDISDNLRIDWSEAYWMPLLQFEKYLKVDKK